MMQEVEHKEIPINSSAASSNNPQLTASGDASSITIPPVSNVSVSTATTTTEVKAPEDPAVDDEPKSPGWSLTGWLKSASNNQFVQKMMEKTKTGVDKMITTLDPGMAPYIKSGGDVYVVVASDKEVKWGAVRDAFQSVFGAATAVGIEAQSNIASQPVGYTAGMKGAQERIKSLRKSGKVDEKQLCVAIESFIVEQLPDHWFDVSCILLDDPENNIKFEVFTLAVPIDGDIIADMQKATPSDYDLRWSGLSVTVGETIQQRLSWVKPSDWHRALTGQSRRDILYAACLLLAELYKRRLPDKIIEQQI